ncbi:MAG: PKD domain-containing protein [Flavobacteriales bacterium]
MEDKIKEIVSQKLGGHTSTPPDACWEHVSSRISVQAKGWATQTKWLVAAGAAVAAASVGVILFIQQTNETQPRTQRSEEPQLEQVGQQETPLFSADSLNISLKNSTENGLEEESAAQPTVPVVLMDGLATATEPSDERSPSTQPIDVTRPSPTVPSSNQSAVSVVNEVEEVQSLPLTMTAVNASEMLFFFIPSETDASEYRWEFGDGNTSNEMSPEHMYDAPGIYEVKLKVKKNGVENGVQKQVECLPASILVVPTIFTPNGDGKNDFFDPNELSKYVQILAIQISDDAGRLVYRSMTDSPWNGLTMEGVAAPEGNYLYEIRGEDLRQRAVEKRGFVFLQR